MKNIKSLLQSSNNFRSGYSFLARFSSSTLLPEDLSRSFKKSLPKIIGNVVYGRKYLNVSRIVDKIHKATEYNMRTENNIGGATLLHTYNILEKIDNISENSFQQAFVLAWAVEIVHSHNLMIENTKSSVPENATAPDSCANDAELLRSFMYIMLEQHFDGYSRYKDFLELFNKAFLYNAVARDTELATSIHSSPRFDCDQNLFDQLCKYKSYPSFELPMSLAMKLTFRSDEKLYSSVNELCSEMGKLYKIKKDFKDCFGNETIIGTDGTDIQRGKCTWLATAALQRFEPRERLVFTTCYGSEQPAHVERVKLLYKQAQLPKLFEELQISISESIKQKAEKLEKEGVPSAVFIKILDDILRDEKASVNEELY